MISIKRPQVSLHCKEYTSFNFFFSLQQFIFLILQYSIRNKQDIKNLKCSAIKEKNKSKSLSYPCNRPRRPIELWDVEALTFSLDNRLTDGGNFVSLSRRPSFTPQEDSWYSFLLEAESTPKP
jgi:hypothetical protein